MPLPAVHRAPARQTLLYVKNELMYTIAMANNTALLREAFLAIFRSTGMFVLLLAFSGPELLEYLSHAAPVPDIVFIDLDISFPEGLRTISHITANYPLIKVIALSAFCSEKHIIDVLNAGARGYLTRDTDKEEILFAANKVMSNDTYIPARILQECRFPVAYLKPGGRKKYKTHLLNEREYEFLSYCATSMSYKEIAHKMCVKYKTIDTYRATVGEKLDIHTRSGLAVYAVKNGLDARL